MLINSQYSQISKDGLTVTFEMSDGTRVPFTTQTVKDRINNILSYGYDASEDQLVLKTMIHRQRHHQMKSDRNP